MFPSILAFYCDCLTLEAPSGISIDLHNFKVQNDSV